MTNPSSYLFYHRQNSENARKEGTYLTRVFITDRRMTVYSKRIVKTAKSGVLFEKIIEQQTFSLHENRNGEKYLKRFTKSASGSITDTSFDVAMVRRNGDNQLIRSDFNQECKKLQEDTILSWFGYDPMPGLLVDLQNGFLFPALRDTPFPWNPAVYKTLTDLQVRNSKVTKALRENNSWESFLRDICKPTLHTSEDVALVMKYSTTLIPIACMQLPPLAAMVAADGETLNIVSAFEPFDLGILSFMFNHLPSEKRSEALQTVLALTKIHSERKDNNLPMRRSVQSAEPSLKRVPANLRPELATNFLTYLVKYHNEIKAPFSTVALHDSYLQLQLTNVFRYWFAQIVLEPQLKSSVTVEDVEKRYFELFGVTLSREPYLEHISVNKERPSVKFHTKGELIFCSLNMMYSKGKIPQYQTDLFSNLGTLTRKRPKDRGAGAGYSALNGYIAEDRSFVPLAGGLYSLDDIMNIIEMGAAATDEQLTKLGRKITPANRTAFLTFGSKERKFKNTWKYYDWGVTDPDRILALKAGKVTKKEDVQTYNSLPDYMLHELLAMESGKEFTTMTNY